MITKLLRKTEFKHLTSLVSPAFFEVLPSKLLWSEGRQLVASYRDGSRFREVVETRRAILEATDLPVRLGAPDEYPSPDATPFDPRAASNELRTAYGEAVLRLYFNQVVQGDTAILDFRATSLRAFDSGREHVLLVWTPGRIYTSWDENFRCAIRDVYRGFYGDDQACFLAGLDRIGLREAAPLFRDHFGSDQTATRFDLQQFIDSFHAIFTFCQERRIELHRSFLSFGIGLATLYENLDELGVPLNAREAYWQAGDAPATSRSATDRSAPCNRAELGAA